MSAQPSQSDRTFVPTSFVQFLEQRTRALPDITVRSGSPANFKSPDSPKTGRSPSRTPDFYHLKKWEKNPKKQKFQKKF